MTWVRFPSPAPFPVPRHLPEPLIFLLLLAFLAGPARGADTDSGVPDPLGVEQALELAEQSPRGERLGPLGELFPRRLPLYLDCHHLAYSHTEGDDRRSRPLDALLAPLDAQRLEILARFFDVLLADLSFARYNEAMAVAYIQYDRANVRRELGQFSEVRVAELEAVYQDVRRKRAASQISQRLTRSLLAQAIGRPEELPRDLSRPTLPEIPGEPPDLEEVVAAATSDNGALAALKEGAGDAGTRLVDMELRQQALELLLRLQALATAAEHAASELLLSDLKLDESRTLYEQEVKADLGFTMSRQTLARLDEQRVAYCRALTWAELEALQGRPPWPATHEEHTP
jgi:hypothetical protein